MKRRDPHQWAKERQKDPFFIKAKQEGYRARSAYKLIEMDEKFSLIPKSGNVLDLGAAPGAWLQVIRKKSPKLRVFGIDLLEIQPIADVEFLQANIFSPECESFLEGIIFQSIFCDISPNLSGMREQDHLKTIHIAEHVFEFLQPRLAENGVFCLKLFDGSGIKEYVESLRKFFASIKFFKPKASNADSAELYLVCKRV
jgi:23S rRNA (uridine2552-2'-O)-methyltransferase